jgi:hypothetical protein
MGCNKEGIGIDTQAKTYPLMNVYIDDQDPRDPAFPRRDWAKLLAPIAPMEWDPQKDAAIAGDVLICHATDIDDEDKDAAALAAARGVVVLFISGAHLSGKLDRGIYHRYASVDKPLDPVFAASFQRFVQYLKANGRPRWDLIEPLVAPESLLAYYLCLLADMEELVSRPIGAQALRDAARAQCDELLKKLADASLPPVGCELTRDNIHRILSVV